TPRARCRRGRRGIRGRRTRCPKRLTGRRSGVKALGPARNRSVRRGPSDDAPRATFPTDPGFVDAPQVREGQRSKGERCDRGTPLPALREVQRARVLALPDAGLGPDGVEPPLPDALQLV